MFTIEQVVKKEGFENRFVVEVKAKFVNAQGGAIVEIGGFIPGEDDGYLSDLLDTCKRLVDAYKFGREATDEYFHVDGYERWFAPSSLMDDERQELPKAIRENAVEWLADPTGLPGARATFDSYQLYYYDGEGTKFTVAYTPEKMRKVSSSLLNAIGYDAKNKKLRVEFSKGQTYVYFDVPQSVYNDLVNAPSVGRHFLKHIKEVYEFEREV